MAFGLVTVNCFGQGGSTMNMPRWFWHLGVGLALSVVAPCFLIDSGEPATPESIRSSPPDMTPYARPAVPEDSAPLGRGAIPPQLPPQLFDLRIVDTVVSNTNPILTDIDTFNVTVHVVIFL
jgi:hypothetical protein